MANQKVTKFLSDFVESEKEYLQYLEECCGEEVSQDNKHFLEDFSHRVDEMVDRVEDFLASQYPASWGKGYPENTVIRVCTKMVHMRTFSVSLAHQSL